MAIFHLSVKTISRGKGQSAVASAAYRSGSKLYDERYKETHNYANKRFVEYSEIQLPKQAPEAYKDRATLWNAVEKAEKAKNARLAREIELALPKEISLDQQMKLVHDYVQTNFVDQGMVADWSIHNPQPDKDNPEKPANPHVHIMLTVRSIKKNGTWAPKKRSRYKLDENGQKIPLIDPKTGKQKLGARNAKQWEREYVSYNDWNDQDNVEKWHKNWAEACNVLLKPDQKIDHRSYKRQGKEQIPTQHEGHYAQALERKRPGSSWKVAQNQEIREQNRLILLLLQQWRKIEKAISELKQKIANAKNLEEERINEQLRELREFNASFSTSDGNSQATETTGRPTPTKERGTISADTEALIRQTEAQRSAETTQQRLAELERATREAERRRQGSTREQPTKAPERPIKPGYPIRKGRGREI